jgi:hypothetical protein
LSAVDPFKDAIIYLQLSVATAAIEKLYYYTTLEYKKLVVLSKDMPTKGKPNN